MIETHQQHFFQNQINLFASLSIIFISNKTKISQITNKSLRTKNEQHRNTQSNQFSLYHSNCMHRSLRLSLLLITSLSLTTNLLILLSKSILSESHHSNTLRLGHLFVFSSSTPEHTFPSINKTSSSLIPCCSVICLPIVFSMFFNNVTSYWVTRDNETPDRPALFNQKKNKTSIPSSSTNTMNIIMWIGW